MLELNISTVSRALRDDTSRVSKRTIRRVKTAAAELGYTPDPIAQALRGGRSYTLAVLVPTLLDTVMAQLCQGIQSEAYDHGYIALIGTTLGDEETRSRLISSYTKRRVDAILIADSLTGQELPPGLEIARNAPPAILVLRDNGNLPSATVDDFNGGQQVADHLLERGHRTFAVVAADERIPSIENRVRGFLARLDRAGISQAEIGIIRTGVLVDDGYVGMQALLSQGIEATAVFCLNDQSAVGAMAALGESGLKVGVDVAVVGFGDDALSARLATGLTSVRTDIYQLGREAVASALGLIDGGYLESLITPVTLVTRESSQKRFGPAETTARVGDML